MSALSQLCALDDVVTPPVIGDLRTQILASRARHSGTYWYALAAPPRLLVEQVIQHLRTLVPDGQAFVGAEWWSRAATTDTGFPFHFDRDEGIRSAIISPAVASILYLSTAGGPTLVLDAMPARAVAPKAAIGVHPRPGRFVRFPGALLHGVLPGAPGRWPRVTLLVNWWRAVPRMECAKPRGSTPASTRRRVAGHVVDAAPGALEAFAPTRLMARAAWLDILAEQTTTYRR